MKLDINNQVNTCPYLLMKSSVASLMSKKYKNNNVLSMNKTN